MRIRKSVNVSLISDAHLSTHMLLVGDCIAYWFVFSAFCSATPIPYKPSFLDPIIWGFFHKQ